MLSEATNLSPTEVGEGRLCATRVLIRWLCGAVGFDMRCTSRGVVSDLNFRHDQFTKFFLITPFIARQESCAPRVQGCAVGQGSVSPLPSCAEPGACSAAFRCRSAVRDRPCPLVGYSVHDSSRDVQIGFAGLFLQGLPQDFLALLQCPVERHLVD